MKYLALGDSISIDDYTGVPHGGAASQFARLAGATHVQDLTRDGRTTAGVLESLAQVTTRPDIVTLTAGGNDFLQIAYEIVRTGGAKADAWADLPREPLANLERIAGRLEEWGSTVILNTVYDPTDGDGSLLAAYGVGAEARGGYTALNDGIRDLARRRGFLLSDLQSLFRGHGAASPDPWIVSQIEPNHAGATAIARHWHELSQRKHAE